MLSTQNVIHRLRTAETAATATSAATVAMAATAAKAANEQTNERTKFTILVDNI